MKKLLILLFVSAYHTGISQHLDIVFIPTSELMRYDVKQIRDETDISDDPGWEDSYDIITIENDGLSHTYVDNDGSAFRGLGFDFYGLNGQQCTYNGADNGYNARSYLYNLERTQVFVSCYEQSPDSSAHLPDLNYNLKLDSGGQIISRTMVKANNVSWNIYRSIDRLTSDGSFYYSSEREAWVGVATCNLEDIYYDWQDTAPDTSGEMQYDVNVDFQYFSDKDFGEVEMKNITIDSIPISTFLLKLLNDRMVWVNEGQLEKQSKFEPLQKLYTPYVIIQLALDKYVFYKLK